MRMGKLFQGAVLPLLLAAAACMAAGCKNDSTKGDASSSDGASHSTMAAALPASSKDSAAKPGGTTASSKTSTATRATAGSGSTAGAPTAGGQPLTPGAPGATPGPDGSPAGNAAPTKSPSDQLLKPTPEQKAREKAIVDDANHQLTILRSQQTLSPQEKMKRYQAINESANANLMALLTPEQRSKLAAKQEEQMQLASGRIVSDLDQGVRLSPAQKVRMLSLLASSMKQERSLLENGAIPFEQKKASIQTLRQSVSAQMQALLTPPQLKIVQAINAKAMAAAHARSGAGQQPLAASGPQ